MKKLPDVDIAKEFTPGQLKEVDEIMVAIEKEFKLKRGGSSPDGRLSLFLTRCIGACAMAPNIIVDEEVIGKATKDTVLEKIRLALASGGLKP